MAASFLHGVETTEINTGTVSINVVNSSVIGLVGIAPTGNVNELTLVTSPSDAAAFGSKLTGFNIPESLDAIFKQGSATVLVVNVFDSTAHTTAVTAESHTVTSGKFSTTYNPTDTVVLKNTGGTVTYTVDTDYSIDKYGNVVILPGSTILEGGTVTATYRKLNSAAVVAADIIGEIDGDTDTYTGMQLFDKAYTMYGIKAKILIAPGYSTLSGVNAEMASKALKYRAVDIVDAPSATTVNAAIAGRATAGTISGFNSTSKRRILTYPMLKAYSPATNADANTPYSAWLAGVISYVDLNEGFHVSPSNHEIVGITGIENQIQHDPTDATSQSNRLNEVGIVTVGNGKVWGNRNASFPSKSDISTFIPVVRTDDVIQESIEQASLQFLDQPINDAIIDVITESVNEFLRTLVGKGAIIDGKCWLDAAKNPPSQIAAGHLTFSYNFCPPPPLERLSYEREIDINLLSKLVTTA